MIVAKLIRPDVLEVFLVHGFRRLRVHRRRRSEVGFCLGGRVLPHRAVAQRLHVIKRLIQHLVAKRAHGFPISRVKRFLRF